MKRLKLFSILGVLILLFYITSESTVLIPKKELYDKEHSEETVLLYSTIEEVAREQARYIAKGIAECISDHNPQTIEEANKASYQCGSFHRSGGPTGDFFVVDLVSNVFIYDGSPDCAKGGNFRHLTNDEECSMHSNNKMCNDAIRQMNKVFNTTKETKAFWKFDNSRELLEWYIIPNERNGFMGPITIGGIKNKTKNMQLMVVVGTQEDELLAHYKDIIQKNKDNYKLSDEFLDKITVNYLILTIITVISSLSSAILINKQ